MSNRSYCSNAQASRALARQIELYWRQKGRFDVKAWVERDTETFRKPLYVVRSNLRFSV
jgi:hypothetical protein